MRKPSASHCDECQVGAVCAEEVQLSSLREARARATIWDSIRVVLALMHSLKKKPFRGQLIDE